ncbi:MAG: ADP-ribosylation factor-like protein [Acidobacteriota bacterium]
MAFIDTKHERLTIRIVFDGLPLAGKTETVRALAESVGEQLVTPEERDRRTLYFDWMEHTAGLFAGRPIHCQVLSVPGQNCLAHRRQRILRSADAIVFVVDSRAEHVGRSEEALEECREFAAQHQIGQLVVQANKQDLAGALDAEGVARALGVEAARVVPTSATDRDGVRVVFLRAVRAALDRVRQLDAAGELDTTDLLDETGAQALYDDMTVENEGDPFIEDDRSSTVQCETTDHEPSPLTQLCELTGSALAVDPDELVGKGLIWPPVEGRLLVQAAQADEVRWDDNQAGRRFGVGRDWFFVATEPACRSLEEVQRLLLSQARAHFRLGKVLSSDRCLVVLQQEAEEWQLWQIFRRRTSIREVLDRAIWSGVSAQDAARTLRECAQRVAECARELDGPADGLLVDLGRLGCDPQEAPLVGAFERDRGVCDWREGAADELVAVHHELRSRHERPVFDSELGPWQQTLWNLEAVS